MKDKVKIEVIKAQDLNAGDLVLIKCSEKDMEVTSRWAEDYFGPYKVMIGIILPNMEVLVIKDKT